MGEKNKPPISVKKKQARLSAYISGELSDKLDKYSVSWGVSKSNLVSVALGQYFDTLEKSYEFAFEMLEKYGSDLINKQLIEKKDIVSKEVFFDEDK